MFVRKYIRCSDLHSLTELKVNQIHGNIMENPLLSQGTLLQKKKLSGKPTREKWRHLLHRETIEKMYKACC